VSTAALTETQELSRQQKAFTLAGVMVAMFLAALDQNVVSTAGPAIQSSLQIPNSLYVWITTAYMLSSTVLVPVYGKLSDLYGRKRIILIGIGIFLGASALCGLAQTSSQLIAFRALQGIGSASLFTTAFAVIADLFPPSERGKYSGMFGGVFGLASLVGPLLGGGITDAFGWHWVFFINLPIGAVALFFIITRMPPLRRALTRQPKIDVLGAILLALGVTPLLLALSFGRSVLRSDEGGYLWGSWQILALFGAALTFLIAFILVERVTPEPLVDLSLFNNRVFAVGNATIFVNGAAFMAPIIFLPLFMVKVVGVTNTASGLTISPLVMGIVVGNLVSGQLVSRFGKYKPLMLGSLVLLMLGFAVMTFTLHFDSSQREVTAKMILVGLGLGPAIPLYTIAVQNSVGADQIGVATSIGTFSRQMGATIGIALAGTLFANTVQRSMTTYRAEALAAMPQAIREQFAKIQGEGRQEGVGIFDPKKSKQQLAEHFEAGRALALKALRGDAIATLAVRSSPFADANLQRALDEGGPKARLKAQAEQLALKLQSASANETEWKALLAGAGPRVQQALEGATPWNLAEAERTAFGEKLKGTLQSIGDEAGTQAEEKEIALLEASLSSAQLQANAAIDSVSLALRRAFSDAMVAVYRMALSLAGLAFLLTVFLPQVVLRKTQRGPGPVAVAEPP
jgi:EmrB/QacA subfamily drug resistance transporter